MNLNKQSQCSGKQVESQSSIFVQYQRLSNSSPFSTKLVIANHHPVSCPDPWTMYAIINFYALFWFGHNGKPWAAWWCAGNAPPSLSTRFVNEKRKGISPRRCGIAKKHRVAMTPFSTPKIKTKCNKKVLYQEQRE